ncbi:hypothetical protein [Vibrio parahaemolyticus]|uniref:Uncharacterized protein n=1 Tax=Vibrio parahaemolyticus TaxID=670 RepID=A0A249W4X4_VIBPH|nr:hypothetical protein [Vibrio parahaemolyticus]EVU21517.1 hypothetical protein D046_0032 [Vibrio parahaemolyticus V-223/04]ASZ51820.1 hypothetical protein YA91_15265 [Vibrio parahaemolyticus]AUT86987.1 hypothetical protein RK51_009310 [Vibrio parahaemolyticus]EGF45615.1 hypothetical protein VP10329_18945 [Vibrio parahaemolyticus 10329]EGQ7712384.1 hypothetical protein [Vibrio parahaemolyticus]
MDVYTFISKLFEAIAWPLVILVLGLVFRKSLIELLPSMRKLKAGPVEAEFDLEASRLLDASKDVVAHETSSSQSDLEATETALAQIYSARKDPVKMVTEGWANVDGALFRFGKDAGILIDPMDSSNNIYTRVISTDLLHRDTKELVIEIYEMRNRVVQANIKPSVNAAKDYLLAVEQVVKLIEKQRESVEKVANVSW